MIFRLPATSRAARTNCAAASRRAPSSDRSTRSATVTARSISSSSVFVMMAWRATVTCRHASRNVASSGSSRRRISSIASCRPFARPSRSASRSICCAASRAESKIASASRSAARIDSYPDAAESRSTHARPAAWREVCANSSKETRCHPPIPAVTILDNDLLRAATTTLDDDLTCLLEAAHNRDNLLLGGLHIPKLDRTQVFDLLFQQAGRPLRHIFEQFLRHLRTRRLHRKGQFLLFHLLQDALDAAIVHQNHIIKGKHQLADLVRHDRIVLLDSLKYAAFAISVHGVQDLRHLLHPTADGDLLIDDRGKAVIQDRLDLADHVGVRLVHIGDPYHHSRPDRLRQARQDAGGGRRLKVGQDDGDGLRMLSSHRVKQKSGVYLLEGAEKAGPLQALEAFNDRRRLILAQGLFKDILRIANTARGHILLRAGHLLKLFDNGCRRLRRDIFHSGDLTGNRLDLLVFKLFKDLGGRLGPKRQHQHRSLLGTAQRLKGGHDDFLTTQALTSWATTFGLLRASSISPSLRGSSEATSKTGAGGPLSMAAALGCGIESLPGASKAGGRRSFSNRISGRNTKISASSTPTTVRGCFTSEYQNALRSASSMRARSLSMADVSKGNSTTSTSSPREALNPTAFFTATLIFSISSDFRGTYSFRSPPLASATVL